MRFSLLASSRSSTACLTPNIKTLRERKERLRQPLSRTGPPPHVPLRNRFAKEGDYYGPDDRHRAGRSHRHSGAQSRPRPGVLRGARVRAGAPGRGRRRCNHSQRAQPRTQPRVQCQCGRSGRQYPDGPAGKIPRLHAHRTAGRLDPGDDRGAEGQRYRDQPGTGQLRRKRPRLGVRARPGSQRHRVARPRPGRGRGCYSVRAIRTAPLGRPGPHTVQSPNQLLCSRLPIGPPLSRSHTRMATVFDNPALLRVNPEYLAWLLSLPTLERERLLGGNWKIRPAAGLYFKREWCAVVDEAPADLDIVRYWDLAATEKTEFNDPDWTAGIKLGRDRNGGYWLLNMVRGRANLGD